MSEALAQVQSKKENGSEIPKKLAELKEIESQIKAHIEEHLKKEREQKKEVN
jgi:hypothetical protein